MSAPHLLMASLLQCHCFSCGIVIKTIIYLKKEKDKLMVRKKPQVFLVLPTNKTRHLLSFEIKTQKSTTKRNTHCLKREISCKMSQIFARCQAILLRLSAEPCNANYGFLKAYLSMIQTKVYWNKSHKSTNELTQCLRTTTKQNSTCKRTRKKDQIKMYETLKGTHSPVTNIY